MAIHLPILTDEPTPAPDAPLPRTRARTVSIKRLSKRELERGRLLNPPTDEYAHPRTREDCLQGEHAERPCPFVSCKHHLYFDVNQASGSIKFNFPDREVWELAESCALDVADRGGITLEETGAIMNLTRERIRQLETRGLAKIKAVPGLAEALGIDEEHEAGEAARAERIAVRRRREEADEAARRARETRGQSRSKAQIEQAYGSEPDVVAAPAEIPSFEPEEAEELEVVIPRLQRAWVPERSAAPTVAKPAPKLPIGVAFQSARDESPIPRSGEIPRSDADRAALQRSAEAKARFDDAVLRTYEPPAVARMAELPALASLVEAVDDAEPVDPGPPPPAPPPPEEPLPIPPRRRTVEIATKSRGVHAQPRKKSPDTDAAVLDEASLPDTYVRAGAERVSIAHLVAFYRAARRAAGIVE